jgi:hypothetical protein
LGLDRWAASSAASADESVVESFEDFAVSVDPSSPSPQPARKRAARESRTRSFRIGGW